MQMHRARDDRSTDVRTRSLHMWSYPESWSASEWVGVASGPLTLSLDWLDFSGLSSVWAGASFLFFFTKKFLNV